MEEELGYIEAEVDELEKGRKLAQKALAKKAEKNTLKNTSESPIGSISVKRNPNKTPPEKISV